MNDTTLAIVKPDAVRRNLTPEIIRLINESGLKIMRQQRLKLTDAQTAALYHEHLKLPYYPALRDFMLSGDSVMLLLEGKNAIARWRRLIQQIRRIYAENKTENCVHGSDSPAAAVAEISLFFPESD